MSASEDDMPEPVALEATKPSSKLDKGPVKPVPVTLITGFLGSGKTTLVRHILTAPHGLRIAVVLNEFGEGVEEAYFQDIQGLRDSSGEWIELNNGCMCCSVKSEFVQALEALLAKENKPDFILIETTGMANPGPVAQALWTDEELEAGVQLDSIITVVDALNIDRQLHATRSDATVNEAQVQVAYADLILLNKMDLCGDEAIARAEADIRAINSSVHIMRTSHCAVDLQLLLNRAGYRHGAEISLAPIAEMDDLAEDVGVVEDHADPDHVEGGDEVPDASEDEDHFGDVLGPLAHDREKLGRQDCDNISNAGGGNISSAASDSINPRQSLARSSVGGYPGSVHSHSRAVSINLDPLLGTDDVGAQPHDPLIQTMQLSTDKPLDIESVKSFMDHLLWDRDRDGREGTGNVHTAEDIYRVKGVLHIHGDERKHMLQAVYELYNIAPSACWREGERRASRVVIIGRNLNRPALLHNFEAAVAKAHT